MSSFDQFSVVQAWLQSLYGEDSVPEFEISPETVNALFEVASASQRNTTNASLVMEAAKHQIELYKAKCTLVGGELGEKWAKEHLMAADHLCSPFYQLQSSLRSSHLLVYLRHRRYQNRNRLLQAHLTTLSAKFWLN